MMLIRKIFFYWIVIFITCVLSACSGSGGGSGNLSLSLPLSTHIQIGHQSALVVSIPAPVSESVLVYFSSESVPVATVVSSSCMIPQGEMQCTTMVQGESLGTTIITASATHFNSATTTISSVASPVLYFLTPNLTVTTGGSVLLTIMSSQNVTSNVLVSFQSNSEVNASVTNNCTIIAGSNSCNVYVNGVSLGNAEIYAQATGYVSALPVDVNVVNDSSVSLNLPISTNIQVGQQSPLIVSIPTEAKEPMLVYFSSSDVSVATLVSSSCVILRGGSQCTVMIQGEKIGNASIIASANNFASASTFVSAIATPVLSFLTPNVTVSTGESTVLTIMLSQNATNNVTVNFQSNSIVNANVTSSCTIPTGRNSCSVSVTGINAGLAQIYVYALGYTSALPANINVVNKPTIALNVPTNLPVGVNTMITAGLAMPVESNPVTVYFNSSNATLIRIDGSSSCTIPVGQSICSILVKGLAEGTVNLYAYATGYTFESSVSTAITNVGVLSFAGGTGINNLAISTSNYMLVQLSVPAIVDTLVSIVSSNTSILNPVTSSCTVLTGQNACPIQVSGESLGVVELYAIAAGYESGTTSVNVVSSGTLRFLSPAPTVPVAAESYPMVVQLSNIAATDIQISVDTEDSNILSLATSSCTVLAGQNACSVFVVGQANGTANLYATAPGYLNTSVLVTVTP